MGIVRITISVVLCCVVSLELAGQKYSFFQMENSTGLRKRSTKADGGTVSLSKKCRNTCSSITDDDSPDGLPTRYESELGMRNCIFCLSSAHRINRLFYYLWEEEDASWLAVWRVCWAIIQIYEMTRFLRQGYDAEQCGSEN